MNMDVKKSNRVSNAILWIVSLTTTYHKSLSKKIIKTLSFVALVMSICLTFTSCSDEPENQTDGKLSKDEKNCVGIWFFDETENFWPVSLTDSRVILFQEGIFTQILKTDDGRLIPTKGNNGTWHYNAKKREFNLNGAIYTQIKDDQYGWWEHGGSKYSIGKIEKSTAITDSHMSRSIGPLLAQAKDWEDETKTKTISAYDYYSDHVRRFHYTKYYEYANGDFSVKFRVSPATKDNTSTLTIYNIYSYYNVYIDLDGTKYYPVR